MTRAAWALCFLFSTSLLWCQEVKRAPEKSSQPPKPDFEEPPEEDPGLIPTEYTFNPIEAGKNITAGNFYFKKGNHRAAARRYAEATKWDPTSVEAWSKLADASERMGDVAQARPAYEKYLELTPDTKTAAVIRKKLAKMTAAAQRSLKK